MMESVESRIKARLVALTEPRVTMVNQWLALDPTSTKRTCVPTYINHKSLVEDLRDVTPRSTAGGAGVPGSRPCVNLVPIDTLRLIDQEAKAWVKYLFREQVRPTTEANIRLVYERVGTLNQENLHQLDVESRSWEARARLATSWDIAPMRPYVPCPACSVMGALRLRVDPVVAACTECDASWDAASIDELGAEVAVAISIREGAAVPGESDGEDHDAPQPPQILSLDSVMS